MDMRKIPKVDELLRREALAGMNAVAAAEAVRQELDEVRRQALSGEIEEVPALEELECRILARARKNAMPSLRRLINGTGVSLHTNLGRACLSERAAKAAYDVARGYSNLEYNVEKGSRGLRYVHVEELLCKLTGAEAAMVVNNNAAAVLLILSALAAGGEVITSRGELVEIGGSFRVPDIMEACGCKLREVGTTNRTHLWDYERAINENTCALLKAHTSNFRVVGFTESVPLDELTKLAHDNGLPVVEDLGSGSLVNLEQFGIHGEPTVQESIKAGVDVVSFSGDKLLGGPQAGIILGSKDLVAKLRKHPLTRAMRVDKMTLAALEATLRSYAEELALKEVPVLAMMGASGETLQAKARMLCDMLLEVGVQAEVVPEFDQVGGGSVPTQLLPTFAVSIVPKIGTVVTLEEALRRRELPIIGRITHDQYLLDARTLFPEDFADIAAAVAECAV